MEFGLLGHLAVLPVLAPEVHHHLEGARDLRGERPAIQAPECAQGLEPGGDVARGVRMDGAAAALMSGVQGLQELTDLRAAALAARGETGVELKETS